MYALRHKSNKNAYVKEAVFPPRLCEWTTDLNEAHKFEILREGKLAEEFISMHAFNVELFEII